MQRGENYAEQNQRDQYGFHDFKWLLKIEALQHDGGKLERKHRGVEHHAVRHLKHHRVRIAHDQRVPYVVRPAQVEQQRDADQDVAKECGKNGRSDDGFQPLNIKDVHGGRKCETAGGEHHAAKYVEADPYAPRELVAQIRGRTQSVEEAYVGAVRTGSHDQQKHRFPERKFHLHCFCSFVGGTVVLPSAAATASRRWVIHHTPPRATKPSGMKSGMRESTR
jgi:hypothetical protein